MRVLLLLGAFSLVVTKNRDLRRKGLVSQRIQFLQELYAKRSVGARTDGGFDPEEVDWDEY